MEEVFYSYIEHEQDSLQERKDVCEWKFYR